MDRTKLIEALKIEFRKVYPHVQEAMFLESLKRVADADLVVFANEVGVDTDKLFAVPQ